MGTNVATQQQSKPAALVHMIENRKQEISTLFSAAGDVDAFLRILKNALIRDPKIADADQQSVFLEVQKAAQDGLVLDGREAALVRYNSRRKKGNGWEDYTAVSYIPMIQGIQKRVRNTGNVVSWRAGLVYLEEIKAKRFRFWTDDLGVHLTHEPFIPAIDGPKGEVVAAYSAIRFKDGTVDYEVMDRDALDRIKGRTRSKKGDAVVGPWKDDEEEMQKKTVMRRHSKRLDVSPELRQVIERADSLYDFKAGEADGIYTMDEPPSAAKRRTTSAADRLAAARPAQQEPEVQDQEEDEEPEDPDNGDQGGGDNGGGGGAPNPADDF